MQYTEVEESSEEKRIHTGHKLTSSFQQTLQSDTGGEIGIASCRDRGLRLV